MNASAPIIQTEFLDGQGLGNQLWVYAVGRSLAERMGRKHLVSGIDSFKGRGFLEIDYDEEDPDPGAPIAQFNEALYYDPELKYFSSTYDPRVESLPDRVKINGLFQSERYFYGQLGRLSSWVRPTKQVQNLATDYFDTCVLNLRGGEYKRHKSLILPRKYWDNAVDLLRERVSFKRLIIVTDDKAYARNFLPEFEILQGGVMECYAALMGARALAVSNSSFSFFPIKTRKDKPLVIAPEHWARHGHPLRRWAMPSNYYQDWVYIDSEGQPCDPTECREAASKDAEKYELEYSVRIPPTLGVGLSPLRFLPQGFRRTLKNIMQWFFPLRIG